jgi:hypothetical protein
MLKFLKTFFETYQVLVKLVVELIECDRWLGSTCKILIKKKFENKLTLCNSWLQISLFMITIKRPPIKSSVSSKTLI